MPELRGLSFQWPLMLWLMLLVPAFAWMIWRMRGRQSTLTAHYPGLTRDEPAGRADAWLRWLVPLLHVLALIVLLAAVARPQGLLALPQRQLDLMLVIDTSSSMRAADIAPNRLAAAQAMAGKFIDALPAHVRLGLVSVAATASLAQSPTRDREAMRQAVGRLEAQRGTALGSGIAIALSTLRPDADIDVEKLTTGRSSRQWFKDPGKPEAAPPAPLPPGSSQNMAVILISDGKPTLGPEPKEAAKLAADLGIRVYTVGVGTAQGATVKVDGMSVRVRLDEEALQGISKLTAAEYFAAGKADDLPRIFQTLHARLILSKPKQTELTGLFAAAAAALFLVAALLSLISRQRII